MNMHENVRRVQKTEIELMEEWNALARERFDQIASGEDLSFQKIIIPSVLSLCEFKTSVDVIDIGCGTGFLTKELSRVSHRVIAVDSSIESILLAKQNCETCDNVDFVDSEFTEYAENTSNRFDLAIANMMLMTALSLDRIFESIAKILKPEGQFVFTVIHPCFWSLYKDYLLEDWFSYWEESQIESPFTISLRPSVKKTATHIHRPLQDYIAAMAGNGFVLTKLIEPKPPDDVHTQYPERWSYPRFLGISSSFSPP